MTDPKRVLVTGGLGFIGSNLCRRLANDPSVALTIVDNLTGTQLSWSDLSKQAEIIVDDLRTVDPGATHFDEVFHLASPVGSVGILARTGRIATDILELAVHAHAIAAAAGAKLLYVSSSEVYGRDGSHHEAVDLVVPDRRGARMEYSLGKLTAEHVLHNLAAGSDVEVRVVRPFNVAGPGQSEALGFVVPTFVRAALAGNDLPVHGDGTQRRAFCHVDDLIDGVLAVQARGLPATVYNVGQPNHVVTIRSLAERVVAMTDSSSDIVHVNPRVVYGKQFIEAFDKIPDIDRATSQTGWSPTRTLDDLLHAVIEAAGAEGLSRRPLAARGVGAAAQHR